MPEPVQEKVGESFDLRIPGDIQFTGCVRRFCLNVLRTEHISEEVREAMGLVVTELCNNFIEHGGSPGKPVVIRIHVSDSRIVLRVAGASKADAHELEQAFRSAQLGEDKFASRGRGLFLVSTLMDEVKVEPSQNNGGLVVQTVKYLKRARGGRS